MDNFYILCWGSILFFLLILLLIGLLEKWANKPLTEEEKRGNPTVQEMESVYRAMRGKAPCRRRNFLDEFPE
mgnify:CR=1 FL=1